MFKAICGTKYWTDHILLISKPNIWVQAPRRLQNSVIKRLNISELVNDSAREALADKLNGQIDTTDLSCRSDIDASWASLIWLVYPASTDTITVRKHQDWLDEICERIQHLIERNKTHRPLIKDP